GRISYSGYSLYPFEHLLVIGPDLIGSLKLLVRHWKPKRKDAFRANSEINPRQIPKAFESQPAAGEQRQSKGKLGDDEQRAGILTNDAGAGAAPGLKRLVEVEARCLPRWC